MHQTTVEVARQAQARLVCHLSCWINPDGGVYAPCASRIIESALALHLLELYAVRPDARRQLRNFLEAARSGKDVPYLDRILANAVLDHATPFGPELVDKIMKGFNHHTAMRKHLLVEALLYVVGAVDTVAHPSVELFDASDLQIWKQVEMTACKAIYAHALGRREWVSEDDLAILASLQNSDHVWEGNILVHLMVLHALRLYPECDREMRIGLTALLAAQRHDGGFTLTADMNVTVTGVAGTALAEAGADTVLLHRISDWLAARQQPNGAWIYNRLGTQTDAETTAFALETMLMTDQDRYDDGLGRGCAYLCSMQGRDGGVPLYEPGNPSEASITGETVTVLSRFGDRYRSQVERGARFIIDQQRSDGSYDLNWSASDANVLLRVCHGLRDALVSGCLSPAVQFSARKTVRRSTQYLEKRQNLDGGWGQRAGQPSDPVSTGFALSALGTDGAPSAVEAGLLYLCDTQEEDGGFRAATETYSPRPILLGFATLSSAYALRGLSVALRALEDGQRRRPSAF